MSALDRSLEEFLAAEPESAVIHPERVRRILDGLRENRPMGNQTGEGVTLDLDQMVAFYIGHSGQQRLAQIAEFRGYGPAADAMCEFEERVSRRMAEIAAALIDGRLTIAPKGETFAEQQGES